MDIDYEKLWEQLHLEPKDNAELVNKQVTIENRHNKRLLRNYLRECFREVIEPIEQMLDSSDEDYKSDRRKLTLILDILGILALRPRLSINACIEMLVEKTQLESSTEEIIEVVLLGANNFWKVEQSSSQLYLLAMYQLTDDAVRTIKDFQYLLPMLVKPLPTNQKGNNRGAGYLTVQSDSLILGGIHHTDDIDSKVLDRFNQIPLEMNVDLMKTVRNSWKSLKQGRKPDESDMEYKKRLNSYEIFEQQMYKNAGLIFNNGNKFYLTHKYDKRGRVYACGYYLSTQSNSYGKAILNLVNKEVIEDTILFFE